MSLFGKDRYLAAASGKAPPAFINSVWELTKLPPFNAPKRNGRHPDWVYLHFAARTPISPDDEESEESDVTAQKIYDWFSKAYKKSETQEVIEIIARELPNLEEMQKGAGPST